MPNDIWLKFGCFLSGYNFKLLSECSEASKKDVKKITSALVIISLIWAMVGYIFSVKYLDAGLLGSSLGSLFLLILIIQIERQIILTRDLGWKIKIARFFLGFIVAMIGATVVDQYIFKQDIQKIKKDFATERVNRRIQKDTDLHLVTTNRYDSLINANNQQLSMLNTQLRKTPALIYSPGPIDPLSGKPTLMPVTNPRLSILQSQISQLNNDNSSLNNQKTLSAQNLNSTINNQQSLMQQEQAGFLDELELMVKFLINYKEYGKEYPVALVFYLFWLLFFLLIELSVLILKSGSEENDYDKIVLYQQQIRVERLKILEQKRTASIGEDLKIDSSGSFINQRPK